MMSLNQTTKKRTNWSQNSFSLFSPKLRSLKSAYRKLLIVSSIEQLQT